MGDIFLKMSLSFAFILLPIIVTELSDFPSQVPPCRKGRAPGQGEKERVVHPDEVASEFYIRVLWILLLSGHDRSIRKCQGDEAWRAPSEAPGA